MKLRSVFSLLMLTLLLAQSASANPFFTGENVCYTVADNASSSGGDGDGRTDAFYRVNPFSGEETLLSRIDTREVEALAYDPDSGMLYVADGGTFGKLDPDTGSYTVIGDFGSGDGRLGTIDFDDVDGMAVDPISKRLYASVRRAGDVDLLIVVDKQTGRAVRGAFSGADYVVIKRVEGLGDVDDLAFDLDGNLYAVMNNNGDRDRLVFVNKHTGQTTDIGRIRLADGTTLNNFEAFTSNPAGQLIGIQGGSSKDVYVIDRYTGIATFKSSLGEASDYESLACFVEAAEDADLEVIKVVNNPVPMVGDVVTFTVSLFNRGPLDATNVSVYDKLPHGLTYVAHGSGPVQAWDGNYNPYSGLWVISKVPAGYTATLVVNARVDVEGFLENLAEVVASDQNDPDSTPNNNDRSEDDFDSAGVTSAGSSGGGNAGIESNGNMATLLANRRFRRHADAQKNDGLRIETALVAHAPMSTSGESGAMQALIPSEGPLGTSAYVTSPGDLTAITNARSVYAVDYLRSNNQRIGAIFGATTEGDVYDHSKTTCDRLGGGALQDIEIVEIDGHPFVLSTLRQPTGEVDYAITVVAARTGAQYVVDSRFTSDEYDVAEGTEEVLNIQVWTAAPELTIDLVSDILAEMKQLGTVTYRNAGEDAPVAPAVFVRDGRYMDGRLVLNLVNPTGAGTVTVTGKMAASETRADADDRTEFSHTLTLPEADANGIATVEVPLGYVYDATFFVTTDKSAGADQLYYADGPWSYATDDAVIGTFETFAETGAAQPGTHRIERAAHAQGAVTNWASVFRYFTTGGLAVDFSAYDAIEFSAYGTGTVQLQLEKASITDWDHFSTTVNLSASKRTFRIPFNQLRRNIGTDTFTAEDLTLLAFYINGNGQRAQNFTFVIEDLRFVNSSATPNENDGAVPTTASLDANYPNPFSGTTAIGFDLPEAGNVRLTVFDVLGREVARLIDAPRTAGSHTVTFDGSTLPAGTYVYRLTTANGTQTRRMVVTH